MSRTACFPAFFFRAAFFALLCFAWSSVQAQEYGAIAGQVTDFENKQGLPGANISIAQTLLGAGTDARGNFRINRVPPGNYILKASFVGYATAQAPVRVQKDSTTIINLVMRPTPIAFDQVIVTGSRQAEDLNRAANSVNVISAAEIRQRDRMRIDESLQTVPAVSQIGENVVIRGGQGFSLLGLGGSRVLMLIDDVPVLTSDLGRANWDILPVSEVERVEVLKGAASVLYGSGGISGIVNVITRPASVKPAFSFRQNAGVYTEPSVPEWKWTGRTLHFYRTDLSYSQTFGAVGIRLAASRHTSTSDRENGDFQRWYFTGKSTINFKDNSNLIFSGAYSRDARGLFLIWENQNNALETTLTDRVDVDGGFAYLIYNKLFSPVLSLKARASFNAQLIGLPFNLSNDFEPALGWGGEVQANWLPHIDHNLTAGLDYKRDEVEAKYYGKHRGDAFSPYVQETWKVSGIWQLSAGLRYDTYFLVGDSAETQLSPKLGLSYNPLPNTILHSSFGRGFRAPSIAERFSASEPDDNFQLASNPGLRPERSTLFDLGIRQRFGENFSAEVTAFSNEYTDEISLIQTDPGSLSFQLRNCAKSRVQGIESEVRFSLWHNRLSLLANGTWMDARSLEDDPDCHIEKDDPLPYRPRFMGMISPSLRLGPFALEGDYRHASRAEAVAYFSNYERVPMKVVNLRARYQWQRLSFLLQVKNAGNYNYTIVEQNLEEIRNVTFSISGEF